MMSQIPALERLRPFLRLEVAILVALLLVAMVWFNISFSFGPLGLGEVSLGPKVEDARDQDRTVDQRLRAARADLVLFEGNNEQAELEERLRLLMSEQTSLEMAPRDDALGVRDDILTYIEERQLALITFVKQEATTTSGDEEIPTFRYAFIIQGDQESLVGILRLLQEYPAASVQALDFARLVDDQVSWEMTLQLSVLFLSGEQNQDQGTQAVP